MALLITGDSGGSVDSQYPAFSAHNSVSQSIASATVTQVLFQTELFDTNNNFASSRFTASVAGYYQINAMVRGNATSLTNTAVMIYKNGVKYRQGGTFNAAANTTSEVVNFNEVIPLSVGDYLEVFGTISGSSPNFNFVDSVTGCSFSGCFLRPL